MKWWKKEKAQRLDIPSKVHSKSVRNKAWRTEDLWKSTPEMLVIGGAVGLLLVKVIGVAMAAGLAMMGGMAMWGRLRGVKRK